MMLIFHKLDLEIKFQAVLFTFLFNTSASVGHKYNALLQS